MDVGPVLLSPRNLIFGQLRGEQNRLKITLCHIEYVNSCFSLNKHFVLMLMRSVLTVLFINLLFSGKFIVVTSRRYSEIKVDIILW